MSIDAVYALNVSNAHAESMASYDPHCSRVREWLKRVLPRKPVQAFENLLRECAGSVKEWHLEMLARLGSGERERCRLDGQPTNTSRLTDHRTRGMGLGGGERRGLERIISRMYCTSRLPGGGLGRHTVRLPSLQPRK